MITFSSRKRSRCEEKKIEMVRFLNVCQLFHYLLFVSDKTPQIFGPFYFSVFEQFLVSLQIVGKSSRGYERNFSKPIELIPKYQRNGLCYKIHTST
jgi:hypothetical protein